ncbi:MAG TPA: nicotinamide-nucleotide adenylyltransferase [Methanocorpusculum sp.]|nr:nicotinamide-nucleotide adenylyltransferase [Methanocorpusculum sp.]
MIRGLYIGRFQPYHNGHDFVIKQISDEVDELVIGIGSAQVSHDVNNPFTAGERVLMVSRAIKDIGVPVYIIPIVDVKNHSLWIQHVRTMTPPFDIVYSSNPLVIQLFKDYYPGIKLKSPPLYKRDIFSGISIRSHIINGDDWSQYVPPEVSDVITEINGVDRLKRISQSDECHSNIHSNMI